MSYRSTQKQVKNERDDENESSDDDDDEAKRKRLQDSDLYKDGLVELIVVVFES